MEIDRLTLWRWIREINVFFMANSWVDVAIISMICLSNIIFIFIVLLLSPAYKLLWNSCAEEMLNILAIFPSPFKNRLLLLVCFILMLGLALAMHGSRWRLGVVFGHHHHHHHRLTSSSVVCWCYYASYSAVAAKSIVLVCCTQGKEGERNILLTRKGQAKAVDQATWRLLGFQLYWLWLVVVVLSWPSDGRNVNCFIFYDVSWTEEVGTFLQNLMGFYSF